MPTFTCTSLTVMCSRGCPVSAQLRVSYQNITPSIRNFTSWIKSFWMSFQYRIETNGRGLLGGIWAAPSHYSLQKNSKQCVHVTLIKKYGTWTNGFDNCVPYRDINSLTTDLGGDDYGDLAGPSWLRPDATDMGSTTEVFYWMKETRAGTDLRWWVPLQAS